MAAECKNSAAGPPDISQQHLQNRCSANDLHTFGVLRPSHRVADCGSFFRSRSRTEDLRNFQKHVFRNSAISLDHLRRVAREVPLQYLKNASRIFKRSVGLKLVCFLSFASAIFAVPTASRSVTWFLSFAATLHRCAAIKPALRGILFLLRIPAREESIQVFCI